jgi:hypothetical protein
MYNYEDPLNEIHIRQLAAVKPFIEDCYRIGGIPNLQEDIDYDELWSEVEATCELPDGNTLKFRTRLTYDGDTDMYLEEKEVKLAWKDGIDIFDIQQGDTLDEDIAFRIAKDMLVPFVAKEQGKTVFKYYDQILEQENSERYTFNWEVKPKRPSKEASQNYREIVRKIEMLRAITE